MMEGSYSAQELAVTLVFTRKLLFAGASSNTRKLLFAGASGTGFSTGKTGAVLHLGSHFREPYQIHLPRVVMPKGHLPRVVW